MAPNPEGEPGLKELKFKHREEGGNWAGPQGNNFKAGLVPPWPGPLLDLVEFSAVGYTGPQGLPPATRAPYETAMPTRAPVPAGLLAPHSPGLTPTTPG